MVDRRSWRIVRFQAVFLALRHATHGWILVDTGYGRRFEEATRRFPYRFYRWVTPVVARASTSDCLASVGIAPADVRHVIVTHFHADHVGGCAEFPDATFHFRDDALTTLEQLSPLRQVRAAFLPALVPSWLRSRANAIGAGEFVADATLPFAVHDLFGDGSVRLAHLPGHAPGQVGVLFEARDRPIFYVADAFWRGCQIERDVEPLFAAMALQWDAIAYRETVRRLREVKRAGSYRIVACHDTGTCDVLNESRVVR